MNPIKTHLQLENRRHFFRKSALGLGSAALSSLLLDDAKASGQPASAIGLPGLPHFAPKAKRAIYLFMAGAPSQMDLFDYKPNMTDMFDMDLPESIRKGQRLTTMTSGQERFSAGTVDLQFSTTWKKRRMGQRITAPYRPSGRRVGIHPLHAHRGDQPRSGDHLYLHRHPIARQCELGFLA